MTWNSAMGVISSIALFLPIFFIIVFRLGAYRSFPALLSYYIIVFFHNVLSQGYINASKDTIHYLSIINNLLDAPLMLFFLTYFSTSPAFTQKMKVGILAIISFEAIVVSLKGFTVDAITITLGPSLLVVVFFCAYFFIRQTKISIKYDKATGKAIVAASLLFAYGCYSIIYLMYYVFKTPYVADTFLVYFLVVTLSSLLLCTGLIIERKRIQKLCELKQTRKELLDIYSDPKTTVTLKAVVLDFDQDQWN